MIWTILLLVFGLIGWVSIVIILPDKLDAFLFGLMLFIIWLLIIILPLYLIGFHYEVSRGEHTGFITY